MYRETDSVLVRLRLEIDMVSWSVFGRHQHPRQLADRRHATATLDPSLTSGDAIGPVKQVAS